MGAGWTPLHFAASAGDAPSAKLLLGYRAGPSAKTKRGETPLQVIESTCWSGKVSHRQCAQHGPVVEVLAAHQRTKATEIQAAGNEIAGTSHLAPITTTKESRSSCRMS